MTQGLKFYAEVPSPANSFAEIVAFAISQPDEVDINEILFRPKARNTEMPHVIVKLYSGRSEKQKAGIAEAITKAVMASTGNGEDSDLGQHRGCRAERLDGEGLQAGHPG